ncbi:hypothetical protein [Novipirellula galeiformis]|uniref:hypothetical protein n=1 Tax=Novipirellula galeiformis TaxID=2528004 RepID=UPI001E4EF1BF|nr:hypothetical protein [Novipirellula galeiformis]
MSPKHSVGECPICGGGLCGVRICGFPAETETPSQTGKLTNVKNRPLPHGLVVCDECEAIWLEPDLTTRHQYPNGCDARCPVCLEPLWGEQGHWASAEEIDILGWGGCSHPELDGLPDSSQPDSN